MSVLLYRHACICVKCILLNCGDKESIRSSGTNVLGGCKQPQGPLQD